ncbi:hypothetical protein [Vibrio metschnikovii]
MESSTLIGLLNHHVLLRLEAIVVLASESQRSSMLRVIDGLAA